MPSNNQQVSPDAVEQIRDLANRYRTIRFELISDEHQRISQEEMDRASREAASRAEYQFFQQYQNVWGGWDDEPSARRPAQEETVVPQDRSFRLNVGGTVTGRMSGNQPSTTSVNRPLFNLERALRTMDEQGYTEWKFVLEVPGPFADATTSGVIECVRESTVEPTERKYFLFTRRGINNYQLTNIQSEGEYVNALRRRNVDVSHFYRAQAEGRRRLVAKLMSGGREQYQLLLAPVVDDDTLRAGLTSPEYREYLSSHENRVAAAAERMRVFKRQLRDANHVQALPAPETDRGRRAMQSAERNSSRRPSRRSSEGLPQEFSVTPSSRIRGVAINAGDTF